MFSRALIEFQIVFLVGATIELGTVMRALALVIVDLALIAIATCGALVLRDNLDLTLERWGLIWSYLWITLAVSVPVLLALGLNRSIWRFSALSDAVRVVVAVILIVAGAMILGFAVNRLDGVARSLPILQAMLMVFALVGVRVLVRMRHDLRQHDRHRAPLDEDRPETVLLVGVSSLTELFLRSIGDFSSGQVRVAGIVGMRPRHANRFVRMHKVLGIPEDLVRIVDDLTVHGVSIDRVVVTTPIDRLSVAAREALGSLRETAGVRVDLLAEQLGLTRAGDGALPGSSIPTALPLHIDSAVAQSLAARPYWHLKRAVDFAASSLLLIILSPLLAAIAAAVMARFGWPIIFWQQRLGAGGVQFQVYKFRTMSAAHDADGMRIPDAERVPALGRFLRRSRLDELPQLVNILLGQMSFVGPRPLLHTDQSSHFAMRRLVRPGLTGWAQINGGRDVSPADKVALDVWYVQNATLLLDLRIILRTVPIVLLGERANAEAIRQAWHDLRRKGICAIEPAVASIGNPVPDGTDEAPARG